jgi:hypothetical protein
MKFRKPSSYKEREFVESLDKMSLQELDDIMNTYCDPTRYLYAIKHLGFQPSKSWILDAQIKRAMHDVLSE